MHSCEHPDRVEAPERRPPCLLPTLPPALDSWPCHITTCSRFVTLPRSHLLWLPDADDCPRITAPAATFPRRGSTTSPLPPTDFSFNVGGTCVWFAACGSRLAPSLQGTLESESRALSGSVVGDGLCFIKKAEPIDLGRGVQILNNPEEPRVPITAPRSSFGLRPSPRAHLALIEYCLKGV